MLTLWLPSCAVQSSVQLYLLSECHTAGFCHSHHCRPAEDLSCAHPWYSSPCENIDHSTSDGRPVVSRLGHDSHTDAPYITGPGQAECWGMHHQPAQGAGAGPREGLLHWGPVSLGVLEKDKLSVQGLDQVTSSGQSKEHPGEAELLVRCGVSRGCTSGSRQPELAICSPDLVPFPDSPKWLFSVVPTPGFQERKSIKGLDQDRMAGLRLEVRHI